MEFAPTSYRDGVRERLHKQASGAVSGRDKGKDKGKDKGRGRVSEWRSGAGRVQSSDESAALRRAYFTLLLVLATVATLLLGDNFFTQLYGVMQSDPTSSPRHSVTHSLQYSECHSDDQLLSLRINTPVDEELTANPWVSVTVDGEVFRPPSSHTHSPTDSPTHSHTHSSREAYLRVRVDELHELQFPGGNNLSIPLHDTLDLSFDLSRFGFGKTKGPYKLSVEVFLTLLPGDVHYAECVSVSVGSGCGKHTLAAQHTIYFYYIPLLEGDAPHTHTHTHILTGEESAPAKFNTEVDASGHTTVVSDSADVSASASASASTGGSHSLGHDSESARDESTTGSVNAAKGSNALLGSTNRFPLTINGDDSVPGFQMNKLLSLSYKSGCSAGNAGDHTGDIAVSVTLHPQVLAQGHYGNSKCVREVLDTGVASSSCVPASFVLSYLDNLYDISAHIRSETSNFSRSQSFRDLKESSSGLDMMQLRLSEDIQIVLQQAARTPHPTSHLIMLYACHGEVSVGSDPADDMRECTQTPFVWDALMVKCDAYPQA